MSINTYLKQYYFSLSSAISALLASFLFITPVLQAADITGAGATFPYPIYAKWADAYKSATGVGMNYQSVGSGAGIKQIKSKTVDFGASDMPLSTDDLNAAGLIQFPAIMGGMVPVIHLAGVKPGQMKLTGEVLADIYLGKITKWNAPEIKKLNPDLPLPGDDILTVHRSDGSGSTFLWTNYLSKVSSEFKTKVGSGTAVEWKIGIGGKGNEGIAAYVSRIDSTIGYVEYAYALKNKMTYVLIKNLEGKYVQPGDASFKAAASGADWAKTPGYAVILTNQPGEASWPITGASFILMHKKQEDALKGHEVVKFFDWAYKNGGAMASELHYVAMPDSVVKLIQQTWKSELVDSKGKSVLP